MQDAARSGDGAEFVPLSSVEHGRTGDHGQIARIGDRELTHIGDVTARVIEVFGTRLGQVEHGVW